MPELISFRDLFAVSSVEKAYSNLSLGSFELLFKVDFHSVSCSTTDTAQLLLVVSDGRGLFLEGKDRVLAAVQAARNANIFVIFVVLDNPSSRVSDDNKSHFSEDQVGMVFNLFYLKYGLGRTSCSNLTSTAFCTL